MRAETIGTTVTATTKDAAITTTTVRPMFSMKTAKRPPEVMNTIGRKTHMVVTVEAKIGSTTSEAPRRVAVLPSSPSSLWWRKTDSMTTIELSTSMPTESIRPIRVMMLRVKSVQPACRDRYMMAKVTTSETGIAIAIKRVVRKRRRKRNMKKIASPPPSSPVLRSSARPLRTSSESSR